MNHKNLLVLGATGATGRWFVQMALERGHRVTALIRSKNSLEERDGLEIVQGDVLDTDALDRVMEGKDAVLSCLGIRRENQADPWSPLVSPADLTKRSAQNTVNAMKNHGVRRVIGISAAGVGDSKDKSDGDIMSVVQKSNIAIAFRDLENMEEVYANSGLDSLVVRPVTLVDGEPTDRAKIVEFYKATSEISKSDVAGWMLDAIERIEPFANRTEMIGWG